MDGDLDCMTAVERVYGLLLHDFRIAVKDGDQNAVASVDGVIRYFEGRWPSDVAMYKARFAPNMTDK